MRNLELTFTKIFDNREKSNSTLFLSTLFCGTYAILTTTQSVAKALSNMSHIYLVLLLHIILNVVVHESKNSVVEVNEMVAKFCTFKNVKFVSLVSKNVNSELTKKLMKRNMRVIMLDEIPQDQSIDTTIILVEEIDFKVLEFVTDSRIQSVVLVLSNILTVNDEKSLKNSLPMKNGFFYLIYTREPNTPKITINQIITFNHTNKTVINEVLVTNTKPGFIENYDLQGLEVTQNSINYAPYFFMDQFNRSSAATGLLTQIFVRD